MFGYTLRERKRNKDLKDVCHDQDIVKWDRRKSTPGRPLK